MDTVTEYTSEERRAYNDRMWKVIIAVRGLISVNVPNLNWIACQQRDGTEWYGVLAMLGNKKQYHEVFFTFKELDALLVDVLAIKAFEQMYGFLIDSDEDKERKREYYRSIIAEKEQLIQDLGEDLMRLNRLLYSIK